MPGPFCDSEAFVLLLRCCYFCGLLIGLLLHLLQPGRTLLFLIVVIPLVLQLTILLLLVIMVLPVVRFLVITLVLVFSSSPS